MTKKTISQVTNNIKEEKSAELKDLDVEDLVKQYNMCVKVTETVPWSMNNSKSSEELLTTFKKLHQNLNVSEILIEETSLKVKFFDLLDNVNDQKAFARLQTIFVDETKNLLSYFYDFFAWNRFLFEFYNKLSEYEFQSQRSHFNVANVEDWGKPGKAQGIQITEKNYKEFLHQLKQYKLTDLEYVETHIVTTSKMLQDLNDALKETLKTETTTSCSLNGDATVKGTFIVLGDLFDTQFGRGSCAAFRQLKSLEMFAIKTVFIDRDLIAMYQKLNLVIVAHTWTIIDSRSIILDGLPGSNFYPQTADDGSFLSGDVNGMDGKTGYSGEPSGEIFGIATVLINDENLKILANGGRGGKGQNGGNGAVGKEGTKGQVDGNIDKCQILTYDDKGSRSCYDSFGVIISCVDYEAYGALGESGFYGCGGLGGVGAPAGRIDLSFRSHKILIKNEIGAFGQNGQKGVNGKRGHRGMTHVVTCKFTLDALYALLGVEETYIVNNDPNQFENNSTSKSCATERSSQVFAPVAVYDKTSIVNSFKSFLIENFDSRFNKKSSASLLTLLKKINLV